ncbi:hypothetical protein CICLE_v10033682mg [Citrus x clementina]|uniref:Uncharacterized protein n=2 Tax=Citrus clementina TaxID=85681 RepID=V4SND4_CITCL|nr:uncharacterized protein LOC18044705 isoform X1 [Citrus x clementina]XP_024042208.1 uncharacterized protein LOC18044705 isoform X1 [Citrus x clementina]XP_052296066.1 uncharacterized protein LOC102606596 [Citrus sinensis]XP_052296067.1 uncharacterized protein LOC102606596 [Citrus sinensis]ESR49298.1 hypothetical protein CICLE_v10033682mg [Citrus x clementina]
MANFEAKQLLKDKKFWFASFLIAWAAALQGHVMWLQRQDSFQQNLVPSTKAMIPMNKKSELNEEC